MILLQESPRDWLLVGIVGVLVVLTNLPREWTDFLSIDHRWLLGALIAFVAIALIRYLKFALLLTVVLLAIGANVPQDIANQFGIDPQIAMLGLIIMVIVSLSNKALKLPTGLEQSGRTKTAHGAAALFTAILKGRVAVVQSLINQGVNVNVRTISGKTPLMAAAFKGYNDIVQVLLDAGAEVNAKDSKGDTALKIAVRGGFTRVAESLRAAGAREDVGSKDGDGGQDSEPASAENAGVSEQSTAV